MALSECITVTDAAGQELLEHGSPLLPIACYRDSLDKMPVPWHWHEELEAAVVIEGRAVVNVGGEKFVFEPGSGFFINTGALHSARSADLSHCTLHSLCFHPKLIGGSGDSIFWAKYLRPLLDDHSVSCVCLTGKDRWEKEAAGFIEMAWDCCVKEPAGFEFDVRYALSRFIFLLISNHPFSISRRSEKAFRDEERLKAMLRYIQKNYSKEIKVKEIADTAAISVSECLRCFRTTIGTTPIQYVKQYRMQKAADLLLSSNLSISEIGAQCGFYDMSYFSKEFRKIHSCTPSEYRERQ